MSFVRIVSLFMMVAAVPASAAGGRGGSAMAHNGMMGGRTLVVPTRTTGRVAPIGGRDGFALGRISSNPDRFGLAGRDDNGRRGGYGGGLGYEGYGEYAGGIPNVVGPSAYNVMEGFEAPAIRAPRRCEGPLIINVSEALARAATTHVVYGAPPCGP